MKTTICTAVDIFLCDTKSEVKIMKLLKVGSTHAPSSVSAVCVYMTNNLNSVASVCKRDLSKLFYVKPFSYWDEFLHICKLLLSWSITSAMSASLHMVGGWHSDGMSHSIICQSQQYNAQWPTANSNCLAVLTHCHCHCCWFVGLEWKSCTTTLHMSEYL